VIFLSGDDVKAKAAVIELFDAAGFFPIDLRWAGSGRAEAADRGPVASAQPCQAPSGQMSEAEGRSMRTFVMEDLGRRSMKGEG
jgi:hypothetical protein